MRRRLSIAQSRWRLILTAMVALVLVSIALVPLTDTALAQGNANPVRSFLPDDQVLRDETFNVSVTFNVTTDNFNGILLRDNVPVDWTIQVNSSWCTPNADQAAFSGNRSEYIWNGGSGVYSNGQGFTAVYQVTVPGGASPVTYLFSGQLYYYENSSGPYSEVIGGDLDVTVTVPPTPTPTPTITPTLPPTAVPTTSQWGMIGMITLFAAFLIWSLRRRRIVSANKSQ